MFSLSVFLFFGNSPWCIIGVTENSNIGGKRERTAMEVPIDKKNINLACIEYPGVVQDPEKMIETLGGMKVVASTINDPTKRLPLRFRPNDPFCGPAYGDHEMVAGLVIKVKRKKAKPQQDGGEAAPDGAKYVYSGEAIGSVKRVYKFQCMCDFQYLCVKRNGDKKYEAFLDKITLSRVVDHSWLQQDVPYFMRPAMFSRVDSPITDYSFRDGPKHREGYIDPMKNKPASMIGVARARRHHNTVYFKFEQSDIPQKPLVTEITAVKKRRIKHDYHELVSKMFEKQPIWSRLTIEAEIEIEFEQLKYFIPLYAYYHLTGPWRTQWVRFGYDARQDPCAKIYQTLDFRARAGLHDVVQLRNRRWNKIVGRSLSKPGQQVGLIRKDRLSGDKTGKDKGTGATSKDYVFSPNKLPKGRQALYQLRHIEIPDVQELIHANDGREVRCLEKDGWCIPGTMDKIRDLMDKSLARFIEETGEASSAALGGESWVEGDEDDETACEDEYEEDEEEEALLEMAAAELQGTAGMQPEADLQDEAGMQPEADLQDEAGMQPEADLQDEAGMQPEADLHDEAGMQLEADLQDDG